MSQTQETTNTNPDLTPARLLTPAQAAEILVILVSTLNAWRAQKTGLPYVHIGRLSDTGPRCGGAYQPQHGAAGVSPEGDPAHTLCPKCTRFRKQE